MVSLQNYTALLSCRSGDSYSNDMNLIVLKIIFNILINKFYQFYCIINSDNGFSISRSVQNK